MSAKSAISPPEGQREKRFLGVADRGLQGMDVRAEAPAAKQPGPRQRKSAHIQT
jgi:hypothetical protein